MGVARGVAGDECLYATPVMRANESTASGSLGDGSEGGAARSFLGWDGALIPRAAAWLLDRAPPGGVADLSSWIVVVPGSRAARLLLGELVDASMARRVALLAPLCVTPGEIVDVLCPPEGEGCEPIGTLTSGLAWEEAARRVDGATLNAICMVRTGEGDARGAEAIVAGVLHRLHEELAGHGLSFIDVEPGARTLGGPEEGVRWVSAERVKERYAEVVASWGMRDAAMDRVRRVREGVPRPVESRLVLVGVSELPGVARAALDRVGDRVGGRAGVGGAGACSIHALVHAPESEAAGFDAYGCVRAEVWEGRDPGIAPERLIFAQSTTDEADRALAILASGGQGGKPPSVGDVVIGLGDESRAALMELRASWGGTTRVRSAAGIRASATGPGRLVGLLAELFSTRRFDALAALVRHPDVDAWLAEQPREEMKGERHGSWWLDALDRYMADQMPWIIDDAMPEPSGQTAAGVSFVLREIGSLIDVLTGDRVGLGALATSPGSERLTPGAWCARLIELLGRLYGHLEVGSTHPETQRTVACCLAIDKVGRELRRADGLVGRDTQDAKGVGAGTDPDAPGREMRLVDALRLVESALDRTRLAESPDADAVEMVGWLELALDPAPIAVVVGMNEGAVPATTSADPILPGELRRVVGLPGARERLARDAFLMTTVARSRGSATFVCARRDDDGTPLMPSRLMLRCGPGALAARMGMALGRGVGAAVVRGGVTLRPRVAPGEVCGFPIAPVRQIAGRGGGSEGGGEGGRTMEAMSVTSFGTYIASPYEFYLKYVLRLRQVDVDRPEMEAMTFGSLLHTALEHFGRSEVKDSTRPEEIETFVSSALDEVVEAWFGERPTALVRVQVEHARERLHRWSSEQAAWAGLGWRIEHVEWVPREKPAIETERGRMMLSGKIDRIDRHEGNGAWAIIDYKSGDNVQTPEKTHVRSGEWVDLQMPLYRVLASELGVGDAPTLAYFAIPRNVKEIGMRIAAWEAGDYARADEAARRVVEGVQAGEFAEVGGLRDEWTLALIAGVDVYQPSVRRTPPVARERPGASERSGEKGGRGSGGGRP